MAEEVTTVKGRVRAVFATPARCGAVARRASSRWSRSPRGRSAGGDARAQAAPPTSDGPRAGGAGRAAAKGASPRPDGAGAGRTIATRR